MTAQNWQRYSYAIDPQANDTPNKVLRLVGRPPKILELGCAMGTMTQILQREGCAVTAIEIDAELAEEARPYCERLIVGDLEQMDFVELFGQQQFDAIIAADVLEHLKEPEHCLKQLRKFLKPEGYWVISIPNVAHSSLVAQLLVGRFPYRDKGLLDFTHLRFFTRKDLEEMLLKTGYVPDVWERHQVPASATELSHYWLSLPETLRQNLASFPDADTYQFIVRAFNSNEAGHVARIHEQLTELQRNYELLERDHALLKMRFSQTDQNLQEHQKAFNEARDIIARFEHQIRELTDECNQLSQQNREYESALLSAQTALEQAQKQQIEVQMILQAQNKALLDSQQALKEMSQRQQSFISLNPEWPPLTEKSMNHFKWLWPWHKK